ncbi:MAG: SpoIIE family protein phosphatase [Caldithrix sp.]|nr:SpoIIE family protein phosphatase [Caldithrix sp.]
MMPNNHNAKDPRLRDVFRDDFKQRRTIFSSIRQDYRELKTYFLSDEKKERLRKMSWFRRWFVMAWWLLKTLFLNLPPARRILLLIGLVLFLAGDTVIVGDANVNVQSNDSILAPLLLLFVLMLELKDKLLAKNELLAGRKVQEALTPKPDPSIPGWDIYIYNQPAIEIGGDLVDYLQLDESHFGFALGDVAGKGLSAALLMAKLQATLHALVLDRPHIEALGKKLNTIFHREIPSNRFASLLYLELTANQGKVPFFNAGHLPPFVIQNGQITELPQGNPALGMVADARYTEQNIQLTAGDCILIYSDGITEAQNDARALYGEERLKHFLTGIQNRPAKRMVEGIVDDVQRFRGDTLPSDDISILILKYKG